jgi:uncharacterized protein (TIGR02646 family)
MKFIKKEFEPKELRSWFNQQIDEDGNRINCNYGELRGTVKIALHSYLLEEQGFLCCYSGILIERDSSHIEHLKPQSLCKKEGKYEDVSYFNLLAAYPGQDYENEDTSQRRTKKSKKCPFGAHAKDDCYDPIKFVSPLDEGCEARFRFSEFGEIDAANSQDAAALETIRCLVLNHNRLIELRREAIDEVLFSPDMELDEFELRSIANGGYSVKDEEGKLPKFCFVIEQVARQLV